MSAEPIYRISWITGTVTLPPITYRLRQDRDGTWRIAGSYVELYGIGTEAEARDLAKASGMRLIN